MVGTTGTGSINKDSHNPISIVTNYRLPTTFSEVIPGNRKLQQGKQATMSAEDEDIKPNNEGSEPITIRVRDQVRSFIGCFFLLERMPFAFNAHVLLLQQIC